MPLEQDDRAGSTEATPKLLPQAQSRAEATVSLTAGDPMPGYRAISHLLGFPENAAVSRLWFSPLFPALHMPQEMLPLAHE